MQNRHQTILDQIDGLLQDGHPEHGHLRVDSLKREYNQIIENQYNQTSHGFRDIIDVLPSEVSSQIISESLPPHGYSSALLLLTMVSSKWMHFIASIPTLWSQLEIRGSAEDSMAIIHTFTYLSRDTPLQVVIYAPMRHDMHTFYSVLKSISPRLHQVVIAHDNLILNDTIYSVLDALLDASEHIKRVESIRFSPESGFPLNRSPTASRMTEASLPLATRMITGWCFHLPELDASQARLQTLEELQTCMHLDDILARASNLPNMRSLSFTRNSTISNHRPRSPFFTNLTTLLYKNGFTTSLVELMNSSASTLLDLDLRVPYAKITTIQRILEVASRLKRLSLQVDAWSGTDQGSRELPLILDKPNSHVSIRSLRTLEFVCNDEAEEIQGRVINQFMDIFSALYTQVDVVHFNLRFTNGFLSRAVDYFVQLSLLRRCTLLVNEEMPTPGWIGPFTLPALEEFHSNHPVLLQRLRMPCLHSLKIPWDELCEEDGVIGHLDTRYLSITAYSREKPIKLPAKGFPSLEYLALHSTGTAGTLNLNYFDSLTSISIVTEIDSRQATALCLMILYAPEACPSLKEMEFHQTPPEWDILFVMLETRNFLKTSGISRIRRVVLPQVPYHLRAPLACLLRGLFTKRPHNKEISFEGIREVMFDERVVGCCRCLRSMISSCNRAVGLASPWDTKDRLTDASICSIAEYPPPLTLEPRIRDWMNERDSLLQTWNRSMMEWEKNHFRASTCNWNLADGRVEITEHDAVMEDS